MLGYFDVYIVYTTNYYSRTIRIVVLCVTQRLQQEIKLPIDNLFARKIIMKKF